MSKPKPEDLIIEQLILQQARRDFFIAQQNEAMKSALEVKKNTKKHPLYVKYMERALGMDMLVAKTVSDMEKLNQVLREVGVAQDADQARAAAAGS